MHSIKSALEKCNQEFQSGTISCNGAQEHGHTNKQTKTNIKAVGAYHHRHHQQINTEVEVMQGALVWFDSSVKRLYAGNSFQISVKR